jgi:hypothetical protein
VNGPLAKKTKSISNGCWSGFGPSAVVRIRFEPSAPGIPGTLTSKALTVQLWAEGRSDPRSM